MKKTLFLLALVFAFSAFAEPSPKPATSSDLGVSDPSCTGQSDVQTKPDEPVMVYDPVTKKMVPKTVKAL